MAYATATDLVARHDVELIGELASDDRAKLSRSDVLAHPNVTVALEAASGEIEAALLRGGRYTADQLVGLTGNSAAYLKTITCTIAMARLFQRRPGAHSELAERKLAEAQGYLTKLASGENIFGLEEVVAAGNPGIAGPTALEYENLNLLPDRMLRHFPSRDQRLPLNRNR